MEYTNKKGVTYYLYEVNVTLRGGKVTTVYYFSRCSTLKKGKLCYKLPDNRYIYENERNGFISVRFKDMDEAKKLLQEV